MTERTIVLLRHAKAERPASTSDVDRRLSARGHADAAAAGAWLAYEGYLPALVICSPAKRTRQTWHGVALGMAEPPVNPAEATLGAARPQVAPLVQYEPRAYESTANDLLDLVRGIDQETRAVLVIGHNPSISELSGLLDPIHADPDGLRTSGIAVHHFTGEWAALGADAAPIKEWYTARG